MRDPNRLITFYDRVRIIHMNYYPDLRFGQLMSWFFCWVASEKDIDIFYPEENEMIAYFEEFVEVNSK